MGEQNKLGFKVTEIRESRKLTVTELAERSGLATEQVIQIENGEFIPSLSPLIKIARALGVRLGTFLDDADNIGPLISRKEKHQKIVRFSDNASSTSSELDFYALAADKTGRHMEPFIIDIFADNGKENHLSSHEGEEFIYVLNGTVEIIYGKETYLLNEGDSIYYDSIVAHQVKGANNQQAKILAVVYAPF